MSDARIIGSKSPVSQLVTVLRPLMANRELGTTQVLVGHVMLQERLFMVLQDLQALNTEDQVKCYPMHIESTYKVLQTLVQITVLDEINLRYLRIHLAIVVDELQDGQGFCVLVAGLRIVIHLAA